MVIAATSLSNNFSETVQTTNFNSTPITQNNPHLAQAPNELIAFESFSVPSIFSHETTCDCLEPYFDIQANIIPKKRIITATASYCIPTEQLSETEIIVWLYRGFSFDSVFLNNSPCTVEPLDAESYPLPYQPVAKPFRLQTDIDIQEFEAITLEFTYSGKMEKDFGLGKNDVELAFYTTWFPQVEGVHSYAHDLTLTLPSDYTAVSNGALLDVSENKETKTYHWQDEAGDSVEDINVIAKKDFRTLEASNETGQSITVYHTNLKPNIAQILPNTTLRFLDFYSNLFGPLPSNNTHIDLVLVPRSGMSYSRIPLIVVTEDNFNSDEKLMKAFKIVAHELAHFWWELTNTASSDNWIDEGMAEYCALLAMEAVFGPKKTQPFYARAIQQVADHTFEKPLAQTRREEEDGTFYYSLGMLTFSSLHKVMGDDNFFGFANNLMQREKTQPLTTRELLDRAESWGGKEAVSIIEQLASSIPNIPMINLEWQTHENSDSSWTLEANINVQTQTPIPQVPVHILCANNTVIEQQLGLTPGNNEISITVPQKPTEAILNPENKMALLTGDALRLYRYNQLDNAYFQNTVSVSETKLITLRQHIDTLQDQHPNTPHTNYFAGMVCYLEKNYIQALNHFNAALEKLGNEDMLLQPKEYFSLKSHILVYKGMVLDALNRREEAVACYKIVSASDEKTWQWAKYRADMFIEEAYDPAKDTEEGFN
ncbi:MAG: M1 family aminopeptidase [bacterium]|nr:hypothetical protein [bacterium]MBU1916514.1 hypothetical protein [bacterium]